jgi:GTP-binding protein
MLSDHASINVRGGGGGAGSVSLRREKHVPRGGPDGGNGAPGGDVVIVATRQFRDLAYFRHKVHFKGVRGGHGMGQNRHGKTGEATVIEVPVGTEVRDADGLLLADLTAEGQRVVVARGGEGGRGNTCFVSSTRRVPRFAEKGLPGEERWLDLQLKLLADIGLVGLPNAGKSSLLAALTRAHPKVAAYPFTTLEPNLGTMTLGERVVVLADIPGLIEGASSGTGLGDRFLAHIERTVVLVFVVDGALGVSAALAAIATVRGELSAFSGQLAGHPGLIAVNKADLIDEAAAAELAAALAPAARELGGTVVVVSAAQRRGLADLIRELDLVMTSAAAGAALEPAAAPEPIVLRPGEERIGGFTLERDGEVWRIHGRVLERLVAKADLDNEEAVRYLQDVMERAGLSGAIRKAGGADGDTVVIGDAEFELA